MIINSIISKLSSRRWVYPLLAAILTFTFWWSSITKLFDFDSAIAEMNHFGLNPAIFFAGLTIAVQLIGSILVMSGLKRWVWLGAGSLIVMTLGTIPIAHRFWEMEGTIAILEQAFVYEHISLIGGLLITVVLAELRHESTVPS